MWNEDLQRYTIEKDEFGKGIKPPTYSPAAIEPIIQSQIMRGQIEEFQNNPDVEVLEINVPEGA